MKNIEKKEYISCTAKVLTLENDDVLTAISGVETVNQANFTIDMNDLFN